MEKQIESQSFNWFDELAPAQAPADVARQSSPSIFALQGVIQNHAAVVVREPVRERRGVSVWVLALAAIAGASVFILGVALLSLF